MALTFDYAYQLTAYVGMLTLITRRKEARKVKIHALPSTSEINHFIYRVDTTPMTADRYKSMQHSNQFDPERRLSAVSRCFTHMHDTLDRAFTAWVIGIHKSRVLRALIISTYAIGTVLCVYFCT